jgi:peroxiredoxin Q/BCP
VEERFTRLTVLVGSRLKACGPGCVNATGAWQSWRDGRNHVSSPRIVSREASHVLKIGQEAPSFEVVASNGRTIKLADYRGQKNVVLFFYPKDFTRVCTAEVCGFRDMYEDLVGKDTEVIGVSLDSDASHEKFASKHSVPYPLVADKELAKKYEAVGRLGGVLGIAKRVTYLIDKSGKIAGVFDGTFDENPHLGGVRDAVAKIAAAAAP